MTADDALTASAALSIFGNSNSTVRSRGGTRVLSKARSMGESPSRAFSTALAPRASPWPSINASTARVTRFRAPLGRPFGLPLCPGSNGRPRFCAACSAKGSKTGAAPGASSRAGGADDAEVEPAPECEASAGASGRCSAATCAASSIPSSGVAGSSEATAGGAVGLSRILIVFYSN